MPVSLFNPDSQGSALTVRQIVDSYLAQKRLHVAAGLYAASSLGRVEFYLGDYLLWMQARAEGPASSCRKSDLESWVLSRGKWKSSHTRNDAMRSVIGCFRWALDEPLIDRCPYRLPAKPLWEPAQPRPAITEDEYKRIMAEAKKDPGHKRPTRGPFRRALFFLHETGARTCEMRTALWEEIDWEAKIIILGKHKTRKTTARPRIIPLSDRLVSLLKKMAARCDGTPSGCIFRNSLGRPWTKDTFSRRFREYANRAGVRPEVSAYCLRHGFCVQGLENGVGDRQLADVMGHTSTKYIEWYGRSAASRADYLRGINDKVRGKKEE